MEKILFFNFEYDFCINVFSVLYCRRTHYIFHRLHIIAVSYTHLGRINEVEYNCHNILHKSISCKNVKVLCLTLCITYRRIVYKCFHMNLTHVHLYCVQVMLMKHTISALLNKHFTLIICIYKKYLYIFKTLMKMIRVRGFNIKIKFFSFIRKKT